MRTHPWRRGAAHLQIVALVAGQLIALVVTASPVAAATTIDLVSRLGDGTAATGQQPSLSHDGNLVAFSSRGGIHPKDGNGWSDVYIADRTTGAVEWVVGPDGAEIPFGAWHPVLSGDGQRVAFETTAALTTLDGNTATDVYVHDRSTGAITLASAGPEGTAGPSGATLASMSDNGRYVLFRTVDAHAAGDVFDPAARSNSTDLYLRDLEPATTTWVTSTEGGTAGNGHVSGGDISDDGRFVVFNSTSTDLGVAGTSGHTIYLRDITVGAGSIRMLATGHTNDRYPRISAMNDIVTFEATELPTTDPLGASQIVTYDIPANAYDVLTNGNAQSGGVMAVSPDGRFVTFKSQASDLGAADTTNDFDVYLADRTNRTVELVSHAHDGTATTTDATNPTLSADGSVVAWEDSASSYLADPGVDTNGAFDVYLRQVTVDEPATIGWFGVTTSEGELPRTTATAGLDTVPIADVPFEAIPADAAAIFSTPLRSIDLQAAPLRSIPLRSIPLRSIPLRSIPLRSIPLRSIAITQLPLDLPGGWAPRLEHTPYVGSPLHTVTLGQLFDLPSDADGNLLDSEGGAVVTDDQNQPVEHPLVGIAMSDLDVSSTPLRSISLASTALGTTPLRSIPLRSIDTTDCSVTGTVEPTDPAVIEANWESLLSCIGFPYDLDAYTTFFELDVAGAPLRSIPLRSIPLRSIDLSASPLRSIPLRSIELAASPLRSIPLRSIALSSTPLRSIPLRSIMVEATPLRSITLPSIPDLCAVVDCSDPFIDQDQTEPHQTLGEVAAHDPNLILSAATLGALDTALDGYVLGDVPFKDLPDGEGLVTIGDLLDWLASTAGETFKASLADLLITLILRTDYPWEELPIADMGLQPVAPAGTIPAGVSLFVNGARDDAQPTTVTVTLPRGARYAPGSATVLRGPLVYTHVPVRTPIDPAISDGGRLLTWTFPGNGAGWATDIQFQMHPGVRLIPESLGASVDIGTDAATASSEPYDVVERQRGDDDPGTAPVISLDDPATTEVEARDHLVVGHIATADDVDYYKIPASLVAGKRLRVDLATPGVDQDLVMYAPTTAELIDAAPLRSIPLRSIAVEDQGPTAGEEGSALPPETLQDIPLRSIPLRSISADRGDSDETVDVLASADDAGVDDYYTIQVSGYNGAASTEPYVLRLRVFDPPGELTCTPRTAPHTPPAPSGTFAPAPAGAGALFVVNRTRLSENYGTITPPGATDLVWAGDHVVAELQALVDDPADPLGMVGHVLVVDEDAGVAKAYGAWDEKPCSPAAANAVVDGIVGLIETAHGQAGPAGYTIPHVVLVGADDVLPQARIPDLTRINERSYTPDVGPNNPIAGAFHTEHLLSDDPYGDRDPIPWLNRLLYVPDTALGRLVETPAEIVDTLQRFRTWDGQLDPSTAETPAVMDGLVTGYDFLSDGARAIETALNANLDGTVSPLINETWNSADLDGALLGSDVPNVAAVNAHFDHHRSLPAEGNATHDESDLFTTDHVEDATAPRVDRTLLFSMGCHSGLNIPDIYVAGGSVDDDDWVQAFARRGAAAYVANTGYGYGDDAAVALTERLLADFAVNLDGSMTVGQAMLYAKQTYASQLGVYGAYDEKVLAEATFYGLPMFRVSGTPVAPGATPTVPTTPVGVDGVRTSDFDVSDIAFAEHPATAGSDAPRFLTVGSHLPQVTHGRPIIPRMDRNATADTGAPAHGVLLTALTSEEVTAAARFARPVIQDAELEPAVAADVAFPSTFATVNAHKAPDGARTNLVLMPAQFIPDEDPATVGVGTERRFTRMAGVVYYSTSSDVVPPTFEHTSARSNSTTVTFEVEVEDLQTDGTVGRVARVLVLYKDGQEPDGSAVWKPLELTVGLDGVWRGTGSAGTEHVEYLVQAVDGGGNVAATSNKGYLYRATADAEPPTITVTSPEPDSRHEVGAAVTISYQCDDNRGLASCTATLDGTDVTSGTAVDTSVASGHTLVVTAVDDFGNRTSETRYFSVGYTFEGFSSPLVEGGRTGAKAGSSVPVKWRLTDANGYVSDPAAIDVSAFRTHVYACGEEVASGTVEEVASNSGLHYDTETDEWVYVWKTDKAWKGQCVQLTVMIAGAQERVTLFEMR